MGGVAAAARLLKDAGPLDKAVTGSKAGTAGRAVTGCLNSFAPATPVLLASGVAMPISEIRVGDRVTATDPATGHTSDRAVTAVIVHHDDDLLDVTVRTADGNDHVTHATAHHPFWSDTARRWVDAADLKAGEHLHTPDGASVTVTATTPVPGTADMWDLTVDYDHTFYVIPTAADGALGSAAVLVHNADVCRIPAPKSLEGFPGAKPAKPKTSVQGGGGLRARWKDSKGKIYEWDYQHGTVEVYSKNGRRHLGEFDASTGQQVKPPNANRQVEP
jgi:hypothetical protein